MKFCKDCKWFKRRFLMPADFGRCNAPQNVRDNMMGFGAKREYDFAENAKKYACRAEGLWWEPKP